MTELEAIQWFEQAVPGTCSECPKQSSSCRNADSLRCEAYRLARSALYTQQKHIAWAIPVEYSWYTSFDEENCLLNLSIPITVEEYNSLRAAKDCFEALAPDI